MEQAKVYFTKSITAESLQKIYHALGVTLKGKVAVKISSGDTNGYSLARKVLFDVAGYKVDTMVDGMDKSIGEALATPHRSYYPSLIDLCNKKIIQGLAHITGSGYQGNIPRILPDNVDVIIDRTTWDPPMIFKLIQQAGSVEKDEMYSTFNMGMGMLIFIDPKDKAEVTAHLEAKGEKWTQIGEVVAGTKQVKFRD